MPVDAGASALRSHRGGGVSAASPTSPLSPAEVAHRRQLSCSQSKSACATSTIWLQTSSTLSTSSAMPGGIRSARRVLRLALMQQDCWVEKECYNISFWPFCQLSPGRAHTVSRMTNQARMIADWLGIAASTACGVHCVLLPTLLVTGTVLPASVLADEGFHDAMLWMILPAAVVAFGIGCWRHRDLWVLALGMLGLIGMVLAVAVLHDLVGEVGERVVTVLSAAILVAAHYRNFRLCRLSDCAHESG